MNQQAVFKNSIPLYVLLFIQLFFLVAAIYPWPYLMADGYHNHQRLIQILSVLATVVLCIFSVNRSIIIKIYQDRVILICLLVFFAGGALSILFSQSFYHTLIEYLHWILLIIFMMGCAATASKFGYVPIIATFLIVQSLGVFVALTYLFYAVMLGDNLKAEVIYPGVENIRFFNQIQIFSMPLLLFLMCRRYIGLLAWFLLSANFLLLFVGGARGATLTLVLSLGLIWFLGWSKQLVLHAVLAFLFAILLYWFLSSLQLDTMYLYRTGTSYRSEMWSEIIKSLTLHSLLWGVGPGGYILFTDSFMFGHPHNSVLQLIHEWGGVAFLGILFVLIRILQHSFYHLKENPEDDVTKALLTTWFAALVYSLFDGVIVMPIPQTLLCMFGGLLWGRVYKYEYTTIKTSLFSLIFTAFMIVLIAVPYVFFVSNYYSQQVESYDEIRGPRFWINGAQLRSIETD